MSPSDVQSPNQRFVRELPAGKDRVLLDLSTQVLRLEAPEYTDWQFDRDREEEDSGWPDRKVREARLLGRLPAKVEFLSASVLALKAKAFDDGLYAAVEITAQRGAGDFAGKAHLLAGLAAALERQAFVAPTDPRATILAAAHLGGLRDQTAAAHAAAVKGALRDFESTPLRSKPIGFYTWSRELAAIFRQDRMLQRELEGREGTAAILRALVADPARRSSYESYLAFVARLTDSYADKDLRPWLEVPDSAPSRGLRFFPRSRAHETDLVERLYGDRLLPEDFSLIDALIAAVREGEIDLSPEAHAGWYAWQTWALETLVAPDRAAEAPRLELTPSYREQLEELFEGILVLTRETHAKQVVVIPTGLGVPPSVVTVQPELSAEPLATYYARRAAGYAFIAGVLERFFGAGALDGIHRLTPAGKAPRSLAEELTFMRRLFAGACSVACVEMGLEPIVPEECRPKDAAPGDAELFRSWAAACSEDPDLGRDARMMVPLFYDVERKKTKVWAFLGWAERPLCISFATLPGVRIVDARGRELSWDAVRLDIDSRNVSLFYPVTAEVYVSEILDREAFHKLCDANPTRSAILKALK